MSIVSQPFTHADSSIDNETRLRRNDWRVRTATQAEAVDFIARTHYAMGAPNTSVARHGLCAVNDDTLRGIALWLPPTKAAAVSVNPGNWRGVLSLSRLCIAPGMPTNSASFLLGASMRLICRHTWPTLLTYAGTREGHTGAIYRATNWACLGEVPGSDAWQHAVTGERRGRKRGGRNMSAADMREAGFVRLPSMPKIKFVHHYDGSTP
jgi:hypothetical protein